jgi:hypothetical protein
VCLNPKTLTELMKAAGEARRGARAGSCKRCNGRRWCSRGQWLDLPFVNVSLDLLVTFSAGVPAFLEILIRLLEGEEVVD